MSGRDGFAYYPNLRPFEEITDTEWARLARARTVTGAKLAALLPAWLKAHMRASTPPDPFRPEFSVCLPSLAELGIRRTDPRIGYYFPGGQQARLRDHQGERWEPRERVIKSADMDATDDAQAYMRAFCKLNHLTGSTAP